MKPLSFKPGKPEETPSFTKDRTVKPELVIAISKHPAGTSVFIPSSKSNHLVVFVITVMYYVSELIDFRM